MDFIHYYQASRTASCTRDRSGRLVVCVLATHAFAIAGMVYQHEKTMRFLVLVRPRQYCLDFKAATFVLLSGVHASEDVTS